MSTFNVCLIVCFIIKNTYKKCDIRDVKRQEANYFFYTHEIVFIVTREPLFIVHMYTHFTNFMSLDTWLFCFRNVLNISPSLERLIISTPSKRNFSS